MLKWRDHADVPIRTDDHDHAARVHPVVLVSAATRTLEHILVIHKQPTPKHVSMRALKDPQTRYYSLRPMRPEYRGNVGGDDLELVARRDGQYVKHLLNAAPCAREPLQEAFRPRHLLCHFVEAY